LHDAALAGLVPLHPLYWHPSTDEHVDASSVWQVYCRSSAIAYSVMAA
jgi:hypothetical protein